MESKFSRWLLHLPVGLFTVFCGVVAWYYAAIFFLAFMIYEVTEDWRLKDKAYIDIYGYLWGLSLGAIILYILREVGIAIT